MNFSQDHPRREMLAAYLRGQLEAADQEAMADHVAHCDRCCQILREIPDDEFLAKLRSSNPEDQPTHEDVPVANDWDRQVPRELRDHPRYKLGKFLGAGGMGLVYQAEHRLMDRQVALKIIHRDLILRPLVVERFRQEVKAAARLSHPNIVTAFDAEQAGNIHFLVMEFVDGISLARLIQRQGPLEVAHACNFVRQAAKGLQHAFMIGMVHRDIKPHNLMLTRKGQVKILDFGLARLASESLVDLKIPGDSSRPGLTSMGDIVGTPDYMAPEQVEDSHNADIRADLYSLGCTLYYLLAGQAPFDQGSSQTKLFSQRYRQPQPVAKLRADLPGDLGSIITKMMAKDPIERYQTPAEVVKALALFSTRPTLTQVPDAEIKAVAAPAAIANPTESQDLATAPVEPISGADHPRNELHFFLARCPFCPTRVRVSDKVVGASILCPQCNSYFTAVPEDDGKRMR